MIILDTHIWIWWVDNNSRLTVQHRNWIAEHQASGLGVSIFSCWEMAKLVEKHRIGLSVPLEEWFNSALAYPGVQLLDLTLPIVMQSTQLPGFHNDPADQIIVATAIVLDCPILTVDQKILNYPNVQILQ